MLNQIYLDLFNCAMTEQQIAKKYYNNRVLPARQSIQFLLWNGFVVNRNGRYVAIVKY